MERQITLTLPEAIYQQVEEIASTSRRPVAEILVDAIGERTSALYIDPSRPAMLREKAAFLAMHSELVAAYSGQYVAIFRGIVIDHDEDALNLVRRVRRLHPNEIILVKRVEDDPDRVLEFRSPHLV